MTSIISWVQDKEQRGFLLADDKISHFGDCRVDKVQLIYNRWAISIYGSSLVKSLVDDLAYFNDKANRPVINSVFDLLSILGELARGILFQRIRWLEKSTINKDALEFIMNCSSGFVILDCQEYRLFHCHLKKAGVLQDDINALDVKKLTPNKIWYLGYNTVPGFLNAEDGDAQKLTLDYAKKRIVEISRLHPEHVGAAGSHIYAEKGQVLFYSLWESAGSFARNQAGYDPYYIMP